MSWLLWFTRINKFKLLEKKKTEIMKISYVCSVCVRLTESEAETYATIMWSARGNG